MDNKEKINLLVWVHDHLLDECKTLEEARQAIVDEIIKIEGEGL